MRVGLDVINYTWPDGPGAIGSRLAEIATTAEDAGFDSLWVMDHYFQIPRVGEIDEPMLEAYSALSYMAGVTRRVTLGTMVTGVIYRHPGFLVKTVTTLDTLSGGRAMFGIGAAWFEREALGLGIPFPSVSERFERLEETLQIAKQMWSGEVEPFEGKHYQLAETLSSPQPVSQPHPPILIGGSGEKKTLRLVAQYANACNFNTRMGTDTLRHKLEVLQGHCEAAGRPYDEIERTVNGTVHLAPGEMTAEDIIQLGRDMADLGFQHFIFNMPNVYEIAPLEVFGKEIIPALREL